MKIVAPMLAALLLAGCVTTSELPLSKNVWRVEVNAGGALFVNGADNAALKKAAELTIAQGYSAFIIANPNTENGVNYVGTTPGMASTNVNYFGNSAFATTTYTPGVPIFAPHKNVTITVVMFHKGDPGSANAIDAAATLKRLTS